MPGGVAKTFIQTKEPEFKGVFDEWLARVVCYAFSVSHQAFVNQVNRSTGETQKEMAEEEGLWPVLKWVKRLIDGAASPHIALAIALMIGTAARIGALLELTWDRVDFERGMIALERLMGLVLTALAVEMLLTGVRSFVAELAH